jgi:hypothetical protein
MPQKIKKRGRPKGSNLTTIGLPKRKKANIIPFLNMPFQNKQTKILSWFVGEEVAALGLDGSILKKSRLKPDRKSFLIRFYMKM